jgi:hypothetical protein
VAAAAATAVLVGTKTDAGKEVSRAPGNAQRKAGEVVKVGSAADAMSDVIGKAVGSILPQRATETAGKTARPQRQAQDRGR